MPGTRFAAVVALLLVLPACQNALEEEPDGPMTGTWRYVATDYDLAPGSADRNCRLETNVKMRQTGRLVYGKADLVPNICTNQVTAKVDTIYMGESFVYGQVENGRVHFNFTGVWDSVGELNPSRIEGYLEAYGGGSGGQVQTYRSGHFVLEKTSDEGYDGPRS
jgi:hypothetical protein